MQGDMMSRSSVALLGLLGIVSPAWAEPTVIWLEPQVPEESLIKKADHLTGGTAHRALADVTFPPMPASEADTKALAELTIAVEAGQSRWDEFNIELVIARDLQLALDDVRLLQSDDDAETVVEALLFQGAAALRAFEADDFAKAEGAAPWRVMLGDAAVPRAWRDAFALIAGAGLREPARGDFVDTAAWMDFQRLAPALRGVGEGTLQLDTSGGTVVVDGTPAAAGVTELKLRAGWHWIHVLRDGAVAGRGRVEVLAGQSVEQPRAVDDAQLAAAREALLSGDASALPEPVRVALDRVVSGWSDPVFLGVADGKRAVLDGYSGGAKIADKTLFTAVLAAEMGGGIVQTDLFHQVDEEGKTSLSAAVSGGGSIEFGISHFLIGLGMDATITPGRTLPSRNDADARSISVLPQPYGGIGVYFLRPTRDTATLSLLGHVQYLGPSHLGYGGRLTVGIPIDAKRNWVRLSAGASYGPSSLWKLDADPVSELAGWLRVGLGARL